MAVVDAHLHLLKAKYFDEKVWIENKMASPKDTPLSEIRRWLLDLGVKKAVIVGQDMTRIWNSTCGNDYIMEAFEQDPNFFVPMIGLEPIDKMGRLNKEALKFFQWAIDHGCRGIMLGPPYGHYDSNDRRVYPFYDLAENKKIIVQFHHGASLYGPPILARLNYTDVTNLNDVLNDFQDLKIVVEHLAFPWTEQLLVLMANNPNVYSDLALLYDRPMLTSWRLVMAKEYNVLGQIMYASDYWSFSDYEHPHEKMKEWISFISVGANKICEKSGWPKLSKDEIEGILWRNANSLYGLGIGS